MPFVRQSTDNNLVSIATLWTLAVFFFAILADVCFQFIHFYTLGIAAIVFGIISIFFAATLIGRVLNI
jgi:hypothetical protein